MPQIINTNVASLNAQRNLNKSQGSLQTAMQRLSSGMRINSAKDDAAGLAISNRMTAQVNGMNQAGRNAADAISLAQTGEAALQEITNNLQRMRELAVQSRNATNTDADRGSLDAEFQQLLSEVDRIAETTAFNGRKILDGTLGSSEFQVGANVGETVAIDVSASMRANSIGNFASRTLSLVDVADEANEAATAGALTTAIGTDLGAGGSASNAILGASEVVINQFAVADLAATGDPGQGQDSAYHMARAINTSTTSHGVTAEATATTAEFSSAEVLAGFDLTDAGTDDTLNYAVSINGTEVINQTEGDARLTAAQIASAINSAKSTTGVSATADSSGGLSLTAADGRNIEIEERLAGATATDADAVVGYFGNTITLSGGGGITTGAMNNIYKGGIELTADSTFTLVTADGSGDDFYNEVADTVLSTTTASTIDSSDILTTSGSDTAINKLDRALTDVDGLRGTFGAIQTRFESTIASLQAASENVSAARSRIRDADFAQETAELTRSQILQQAGVSVLAQANGLPQSVLALLQ